MWDRYRAFFVVRVQGTGAGRAAHGRLERGITRDDLRAAISEATGVAPQAPQKSVLLRSRRLDCRFWRGKETNGLGFHCTSRGTDCSGRSIGRIRLLVTGQWDERPCGGSNDGVCPMTAPVIAACCPSERVEQVPKRRRGLRARDVPIWSESRRPWGGGARKTKSQDGPGLVARRWWSQSESNRRPLECHSSALPTELWPHLSWDAPAGWPPKRSAF